MGLFNKGKNTERAMENNVYLKNYAVKINALMRYTENNKMVTMALEKLQEEFDTTVAVTHKEASKIQKKFDDMFEQLKSTLQQLNWDEAQVMLIIRNLGAELDEMNALRKM